jgi:hypothetical protein
MATTANAATISLFFEMPGIGSKFWICSAIAILFN